PPGPAVAESSAAPRGGAPPPGALAPRRPPAREGLTSLLPSAVHGRPMAAAEARREDPRLESALRDVRAVAEAQARLLRVVEGISEELSRLGAEAGRLRAGELPAVQGPLQDLRRAWQRGAVGPGVGAPGAARGRHRGAGGARWGAAHAAGDFHPERDRRGAEARRRGHLRARGGRPGAPRAPRGRGRRARLAAGGPGPRAPGRPAGERLDGLAARQEPPGSPASPRSAATSASTTRRAAGAPGPRPASATRRPSRSCSVPWAACRARPPWSPASTRSRRAARRRSPSAWRRWRTERLREEQARGQGEQLAELQAAKRELSELSGRQGRLQESSSGPWRGASTASRTRARRAPRTGPEGEERGRPG
ncbi:unnamed protein product, partial [Prorocentrum cordatum]